MFSKFTFLCDNSSKEDTTMSFYVFDLKRFYFFIPIRFLACRLLICYCQLFFNQLLPTEFGFTQNSSSLYRCNKQVKFIFYLFLGIRSRYFQVHFMCCKVLYVKFQQGLLSGFIMAKQKRYLQRRH